jgi:hypothetical protein
LSENLNFKSILICKNLYIICLLLVLKFSMVPEEQENCIVFGTFPFRGSIMSCRLICEFVGLKYIDALFDPKTWG